MESCVLLQALHESFTFNARINITCSDGTRGRTVITSTLVETNGWTHFKSTRSSIGRYAGSDQREIQHKNVIHKKSSNPSGTRSSNHGHPRQKVDDVVHSYIATQNDHPMQGERDP